MSKRKTVSINLERTLHLIKLTCRNNTAFCERMGRSGKWVSDWKRNKNLPSPEEAAQMCVILQVAPQEILTEADDIETVQALIASQRAGDEKQLQMSLSPVKQELLELIDDISDDKVQKLIDLIRAMKGDG